MSASTGGNIPWLRALRGLQPGYIHAALVVLCETTAPLLQSRMQPLLLRLLLRLLLILSHPPPPPHPSLPCAASPPSATELYMRAGRSQQQASECAKVYVRTTRQTVHARGRCRSCSAHSVVKFTRLVHAWRGSTFQLKAVSVLLPESGFRTRHACFVTSLYTL